MRCQTRSPLEIIVVDDGSPTPLQSPNDWEGPELRWIRKTNGGLGAARNTGLKLAKGNFVAFCDADDWWEPRKIELQEKRLDEASDAVACYTRCVEAPGYFPFGPYPDPDLNDDELAKLLWYGQFFPPSSVMMRRSAAIKVDGFREGLTNGEDLDMWFRLLDLGRIVGVPERLCWYRIHSNQWTQNEIRKIMGSKEARRGIIEKHSDRLVRGGVPQHALWHAYRDEIYGTYFKRRFLAARPMLWDYWKDHPTDVRTALYLLLTYVPSHWITALRGKI